MIYLVRGKTQALSPQSSEVYHIYRGLDPYVAKVLSEEPVGVLRTYMYRAPWMVIWPGLALSFVVYGVNMFGDAVRDLLDPRLWGGVGRYGVRAKKEAKV